MEELQIEVNIIDKNMEVGMNDNIQKENKWATLSDRGSVGRREQ